MKMLIRSLMAMLCIIATTFLYGQNPTEIYLSTPNYSEGTQIIPVGIDLYDGNEVNTIYYGRTPSGSLSKPVLIFVHGYASNAQVFFKGNDNMYADVYRDGYRSAYVSLTPNDDMWTNGALLANMISIIKSHYNNAPIVMVGWSKGGVDIDAALVHFGANNLVQEVFTLSTPHFGTSIAELANSVLLSLVNIIFMQNNDATLSLQRSYMSYFRSITDNNPRNTVPYTTIGGWGNGPLNRLDIPQAILHGIDGPRRDGGNDGVVPYNSSIRPGAKELFDGQRKFSGFLGIPYYDGPSETELDHFEVTRGGKVWPFIKNELNNANRSEMISHTANTTNPNQLATSRMQVIIDPKTDYFLINDKNGYPAIYTNNASKSLILTNDNSTFSKLPPVKTENNTGQIYDVDNLLPGKYRLIGDDNNAVMIDPAGPELTIDFGSEHVTTVNPDGRFSFDAFVRELPQMQNINLKAFIVPVADLKLNKVEPDTIMLNVNTYQDKFQFFSTKSLNPGLYQLVVRAEGETFKRDLITSFVMTESYQTEEEGKQNLVTDWILYPNPAKEKVTVQLSDLPGNAVITIYSVKGEVVSKTSITAETESIDLPVSDYKPGLYIVELVHKNGREVQKLLINE